MKPNILVTREVFDETLVFLDQHCEVEANQEDRAFDPEALARSKQCRNLEEAFIAYLREAEVETHGTEGYDTQPVRSREPLRVPSFSLTRLRAFSSRELTELLRDPIRLSFALLGPLILLVTFGYGITFDVERLPFAVLDNDRSAESRELTETLSGSRYFIAQPAITDPEDLGETVRIRGEAHTVAILGGQYRGLMDQLLGRFATGVTVITARSARSAVAPKLLFSSTVPNKNRPTTLGPPTDSAAHSAQRALKETLRVGSSAPTALNLPSRLEGVGYSDHFDNRADPAHARSEIALNTRPSLPPNASPQAPLKLGAPSV